jgi:hypothetical protein
LPDGREELVMKSAVPALVAACLLALPAAAQVPPIQPPPGLAANAANAQLPAALLNLGLRLNVKAYGAKGDGSTDDRAAIQAAETALEALGGGTLDFPAGHYCVKSAPGVTIGAAGVTWWGGNRQAGTSLDACGADVTIVTANMMHFGIVGMQIAGAQTPATTKPAIVFGASCTECTLWDTLVVGGQYALKAQATDFVVGYSKATQSYGSALVYSQAGTGTVLHSKLDQAYPAGTPNAPVTIAPWAAATAYSLKDLVTNSGFILQAIQAGTSGGSAPANLAYNTDIPDGTVKWRLVGAATYYAVQADTGTSYLKIADTDMTGSFDSAVAMTNTLAGANPQSVIVDGSTIGQTLNLGVKGNNGSNLVVRGNQIADCIAAGCAAVSLQGGFSGDAQIIGNTIYSSPTGINLGAGSNTVVVGNAVSGATNAVAVQAGVSGFTIAGNNLGSSPTWGVNTTGVTIAAGASDHYKIVGNDFTGAATAIIDGGTGTHKTVQDENVLAVGGVMRSGSAALAIATSTFTPNFDAAQNHQLTLVHASCPCTLANPSTTPKPGQSGMFVITQSATGSDTIGTWGSMYTTAGGTGSITLSTAANAVDFLPYYVQDATHIVLGALVKGPTH